MTTSTSPGPEMRVQLGTRILLAEKFDPYYLAPYILSFAPTLHVVPQLLDVKDVGTHTTHTSILEAWNEYSLKLSVAMEMS